ncbi:dual specificity protein phosphatase 1 [Aplysia californica]|uniref:protein-tyrosine-phosphatase n=1 Tax=Aplysia californica TaxID=6500 RepID=A0ABM0JEC8_APLCA|nr:dual specificity protein phosphatase 1 [Aplysia californica]
MENVRGLNVMEVTAVLASEKSCRVLVLDCRPFIAFNHSQIAHSVNVHCPPILKRRSGGFIALENIVPCVEKRSQLLSGAFPDVIVYDERTQELNQAASDSNILSVIKSLLKQVENLNVRYIVGGFEAVKEECPVLCMHQNSQFVMSGGREKLASRERKQNPRQEEPSEILPHLYLGDVSHSGQHEVLQRLGITALLNVSTSCENHFETQYRYMNVPINDNLHADLLSWFPRLIQFIDSVAEERGKVLVHCRAGVSRSATVCIAYIMQKQGLSLDVAFEQIRLKRPIVDPNLNFIQQLQKFETQLKGQLQVPLTTTTLCRSAPPAPNSQLPCVFTFSPTLEQQHLPNNCPPSFQQDDGMDTSMSFFQPQPPPSTSSSSVDHTSATLSKSHPLSTVKLELSPSSLSQTAASPSPARTPVRPGSLPLLQVCTTVDSRRRCSNADFLVTPPFIISPVQATFPSSPLLDIIQQAEETFEVFSASYGNIPRTPSDNQTLSFFGGDITCQALALPLDMASPRQCRPTMTAPMMTSSSTFLNSERSQPAPSVPRSPLSPLGVPLSPLPSFG